MFQTLIILTEFMVQNKIRLIRNRKLDFKETDQFLIAYYDEEQSVTEKNHGFPRNLFL